MNVTIKDISYSDASGNYSALNSKLYLMDEFDLQANDGSASQATTYESKQTSITDEPQLNTLQEQLTEQHTDNQSNPVNQISDMMGGDELSGTSNATALEDANPTSNLVNAATSTAALVGINEEAIPTGNFTGSDISAGMDSSAGGSGNGVSSALSSSVASNVVSGSSSNDSNITNHVESIINLEDVSNIQVDINNVDNLIDLSDVTNIVNNTENLATNVVNNVTDLTENVVNNVSNITENVVDEITNVTENVVNNVTDITENVVNELDNVINNILDVTNINEITNSVVNNIDNIFDSTSNFLIQNFETINNTANSIVNYTSEILGDAIGPIQFSLDVDLGLNSNLVNDLNLSDLSNLYSSLSDNLTGNAVFDLSSDFLNLHFDANEIISNNPLVMDVDEGITNVLNGVDNLGDHLPVLETVDNIVDSTLPDLPVDQINLGILDEGSTDPNGVLNLSNNTNITEDLGILLNSDSNSIDNSLDLLNNDGDLELNDPLNFNDNTLINSDDGLDQLGNVTNSAESIQDTLASDVNNVLDETNLDLVTDNGGSITDLINSEDGIQINNLFQNDSSDSLSDGQGILQTVSDTSGSSNDNLDIGGALNEVINQMQSSLEDNTVGNDPPQISLLYFLKVKQEVMRSMMLLHRLWTQ